MDSSQIVNNVDLTQSSLIKGKRRKIDGYIISCKPESITARISEYYNSRRQEKIIAQLLISENTLEVPINQIERLTRPAEKVRSSLDTTWQSETVY